MREGAEAARVRAFFAVLPSASLQDVLAERVRVLREEPWGRDVRWVRRENVHLTLRFLGEVDASAVDGLAAAAASRIAALPPFSVALRGVGAFPSARRPRVVAAELEPSPRLEELARRVEEAVVACGLDPEPRAFRAHMTLGRMRGRVKGLPPLGDGLEGARLGVDGVVLQRSVLSSRGSRYSVLAELPLQGTGPDAGG